MEKTVITISFIGHCILGFKEPRVGYFKKILKKIINQTIQKCLIVIIINSMSVPIFYSDVVTIFVWKPISTIVRKINKMVFVLPKMCRWWHSRNYLIEGQQFSKY